jgi:hypothetical protein
MADTPIGAPQVQSQPTPPSGVCSTVPSPDNSASQPLRTYRAAVGDALWGGGRPQGPASAWEYTTTTQEVMQQGARYQAFGESDAQHMSCQNIFFIRHSATHERMTEERATSTEKATEDGHQPEQATMDAAAVEREHATKKASAPRTVGHGERVAQPLDPSCWVSLDGPAASNWQLGSQALGTRVQIRGVGVPELNGCFGTAGVPKKSRAGDIRVPVLVDGHASMKLFRIRNLRRELHILDLGTELRHKIMAHFVTAQSSFVRKSLEAKPVNLADRNTRGATDDLDPLAILASVRLGCSAFRNDFVGTLRLLAARGNVYAIRRIARSYQTGDFGLEENHSLILEQVELLVKDGSDEALQCAVRLCSDNGYEDRVLALFAQGAEAGHHIAIQNYAGCLATGMLNCDIDLAAAFKWYLILSDKGDPQCMALCGIALWKGDGVEMDRERAVKLIQKAADGGDCYGMKLSAMLLNIAYQNENHDTAVHRSESAVRSQKWLEKAAAAGDKSAAEILRDCDWACLRSLREYENERKRLSEPQLS